MPVKNALNDMVKRKHQHSIIATCEAPVNIAVIKYWGKRDEALILPVNSSLSLTLHMDSMRSRTVITASPEFTEDTMTLNGKPEPLDTNPRIRTVMALLKAKARPFGDVKNWDDYHFRIESENNFPTAAGLASSASGFACLTLCLAHVFHLPAREQELSIVARQGSGSACRSVYGGFVAWRKGEASDGSDSMAEVVAGDTHWPEMCVLILVVNAGRKAVGSTDGMQRTVETSPLLAHRAEAIVEPRMAAMEQAILRRDFNAFAELTMQDSNQFHAVCLDTYPPVFYLNDVSREIIQLCHRINAESRESGGPLRVAYTFDAGPNAVLFMLESDLRDVMDRVVAECGGEVKEGIHDPMGLLGRYDGAAQAAGRSRRDGAPLAGVKRIIVTKVGPGPVCSVESSMHV